MMFVHVFMQIELTWNSLVKPILIYIVNIFIYYYDSKEGDFPCFFKKRMKYF